MTTATTLTVNYSAAYTATEPADLGGVQAVAAPPVSATATAPAVTGSQMLLVEPPKLMIDGPKIGTDPEVLMVALQSWAYSFEKDVLKAAKVQMNIGNMEAKANLDASIKKLQEAIKKMEEARAAARKARMLGIIGKIVGVVVSAVVVAVSVATIVGTGGAAAPAVVPAAIMGVTAAAAGITALIDLGGELHAELHGDKNAFSLAGAVGGGWAGVLSLNLAQSLLELIKWAEKKQGRELSDEAAIGVLVAGAVVQMALISGAASAGASASSAAQTGAQAATQALEQTATLFTTAGQAFVASGGIVTGALGIEQGLLTIDSAKHAKAAEYRRADSMELDARTQQAQRLIEDLMQYSQRVNDQLQSATSNVAKLITDWTGSMATLAGPAKPKSSMA